MFDRGQGPPVVVIPGLQGRWEWMAPALAALSRRCRTISYTLCGEYGSRMRFDAALGFENYLAQLDAVLDRAGLERAAICGVSYGGYVALRYAVERPDRVSALVLVSTPGPGFRPSTQQARWLARPWLSAPAFVLTAPIRLGPEIRAAIPTARGRAAFFVRQALRCIAAPIVPSRMASRMSAASTLDAAAHAARVGVPTLVVSGEEGLDRVVPVASTRAYASLIRGATYRPMPRTGHMGLLTQPEPFARIVSEFVHANHH